MKNKNPSKPYFDVDTTLMTKIKILAIVAIKYLISFIRSEKAELESGGCNQEVALSDDNNMKQEENQKQIEEIESTESDYVA